jgi:hypothetical protein
MPVYVYRCKFGCETERYLTLAEHKWYECTCPVHRIPFRQIITAPMLVKVAQDICYDSPIDGTPITSWAQRREDLAKHGCIPYDPEMKKDAIQRTQEADARLDSSIEATVEASYARMPETKRKQLKQEVIDQGMEIQIERRVV